LRDFDVFYICKFSLTMFYTPFNYTGSPSQKVQRLSAQILNFSNTAPPATARARISVSPMLPTTTRMPSIQEGSNNNNDYGLSTKLTILPSSSPKMNKRGGGVVVGSSNNNPMMLMRGDQALKPVMTATSRSLSPQPAAHSTYRSSSSSSGESNISPVVASPITRPMSARGPSLFAQMAQQQHQEQTIGSRNNIGLITPVARRYPSMFAPIPSMFPSFQAPTQSGVNFTKAPLTARASISPSNQLQPAHGSTASATDGFGMKKNPFSQTLPPSSFSAGRFSFAPVQGSFGSSTSAVMKPLFQPRQSLPQLQDTSLTRVPNAYGGSNYYSGPPPAHISSTSSSAAPSSFSSSSSGLPLLTPRYGGGSSVAVLGMPPLTPRGAIVPATPRQKAGTTISSTSSTAADSKSTSSASSWIETLFGISEKGRFYKDIQSNFDYDQVTGVLKANGSKRKFKAGW
jgi:hypothetical protein